MFKWEGKHCPAFQQTYTLAKVSYKTSEFYLFYHAFKSHLQRIPQTTQQVITALKTNKDIKIPGPGGWDVAQWLSLC